eukprot:m.856111 g.856111  ORF g.856111 m.856111 type:complete len:378 (+) comp59629_c0_seq11:1819-2952(+)
MSPTGSATMALHEMFLWGIQNQSKLLVFVSLAVCLSLCVLCLPHCLPAFFLILAISSLTLDSKPCRYLAAAKACDGKAKDLAVRSRFWKHLTLLAYRDSQVHSKNSRRSHSALDLHALENLNQIPHEKQVIKILLTGTFGEESMLSLARGHLDSQSSHVVADARLALKIDMHSSVTRATFSKESNRARTDLLALQTRHLGKLSHLVHLRLHPLRSVAELAAMNETEWSIADSLIGALDGTQTLPPLTRALYYWVAMNQYLDMVADCGFRVEDIALLVRSSTSTEAARACPERLVERILSQFATEETGSSLLEDWRQRYPELRTTSWEDLQEADPLMAQTACAMTLDYGYECPLLSPEADFSTKFHPKDVSSTPWQGD